MATRSPSASITASLVPINSSMGINEGGVSERSITLVALLFAAVAFFAAFFQALLQYLTSPQRDKCLSGAIGGWSRFTKTGWDVSRWRMRAKYARLDLDLNKVLMSQKQNRPEEIVQQWATDNLPGYGREFASAPPPSSMKTPYSRSSLIYSNVALVRLNKASNEEVLTFWDLNIKQRISWLAFLWKNRHNRVHMAARAGWANFLGALGVNPDPDLIKNYSDADVIPSGVDVAIQRIRVSDLAVLCYMANLKNVSINVGSNANGSLEGFIHAGDDWLKVDTHTVPGVGQAVTFDGDFDQLRDRIGVANRNQLFILSNIAIGSIMGDLFDPNIYSLDLSMMLYGFVHGWDHTVWREHNHKSALLILRKFGLSSKYRKELTKISPTLQVDAYITRSDPNSSWTETWHHLIDEASPTIIKYLALMPFTGIWSAAPLRLFISPYFDHLKEIRVTWVKNTREISDIGIQLLEHPQLDSDIVEGAIPFLRETSDFSMILNTFSSEDVFTWAWTPFLAMLKSWRSDILTDFLQDSPQDKIFLPSGVIRLLEGTPIAQERLSDRISSYVVGLSYTLESTILLSLILVDFRIQVLWSQMDENSALHKFYQKYQNRDPIEMIFEVENTPWRMEQQTADFLALFIEIANRVDIVGDTQRLQSCVDEVLDLWKSDDNLCISTPVQADSKDSNSLKRKELVQWILEKDTKGKIRLQTIRRILTLFQLRIFLMGLSYECHSDSSDVCLAREQAKVNVRLI